MSGDTMSGVLEPAPPAAAPHDQSRGPWAAVFALARFEARDLLGYLPVVATLLLNLGYTGWRLVSAEGTDAYPALQDADRATQGQPLLLGIVLFVCVNRAVLRSRRRDTDRHFDVLPVAPWRRTIAHLLSVVPFGVFTAAVVLGEFTWQALRPGAVGHGSAGELAVGPLTVLLCGALGVLAARLVPHTFAAPVLLVGLYTLFVFVTTGSTEANWSRWLSAAVGENDGETLPSDLIGRPAGWHALYLTGLVLLAACVGVLAAGGRARPLKVCAAVAVGLTLTGAVAQSGGVSAELAAARKQATVTPEKVQSCAEHGSSVYCAYPEWTGRAGTWATVVDRVQSLAGGTAAGQRLLVRQRVDSTYGLESDTALNASTTPGQVTVGTRWGGTRVPEFATAVASVLVAGDEEAGGELCDGRVVTVMWLALGGAEDPLAELRTVRLDDSVRGSAIALTPTGSLSMSAGQTGVVVELLERPRAEVAAAVRAHWDELTGPGVTTAEAARTLGADVPEGGDECER
ncbi:ABC transporter permease [Streptomyces ziwulingensis]|uniref:ABC transporter n=1 Tax=Streptomyces ziwulingensis TaxID=1045501 RepID=A0ABP9AWD5_9ACTN